MVTVVVPVYNGAAFIAEQLDALAAQDYPDPWDVVIADNGSTDETVSIVGRYEDRLALTVVDASAVKGVSYARTLGARAAAGDLIAYADADDIVAPDWLSQLVAAWQPGTVVAGALEHDTLNVPAHIHSRGRGQSRELPLHMGFLPTAAACNLLIERSVLDEVGGWRLDLRHGEDVELCWKLQLAGHPLVFAPKAVVHYRLRGTARQLYRQIYWYNDPYPLLYKEFKAAGARRRTVGQIARSYLWVLTRLPYLVMDDRRKYVWCAVAGENAGRIAGSVRHRSFCL
ncbi:MAG: hypothetical protein JWM93_2637 [Frankiales bacterium]|nr:hypothetical protein [Frankiales bacterium]